MGVTTLIPLALVLLFAFFVPGPCTFDPRIEYDCVDGNRCPADYACANDGYCKAAASACGGNEELCGQRCLGPSELASDPEHCGSCDNVCTGGSQCSEGQCVGKPTLEANECDPARGNWDCANGMGCVDTGVRGLCVADQHGDTLTGGLCSSAEDCSSGLCARGVCTVPCEAGCRAGYICDAAAIPGGVCAPIACRTRGDAACKQGWICVDSSTDDDGVCALEGTAFEEAVLPSCAAAGSGVVAPSLLALSCCWLWRRRSRGVRERPLGI